MLYLMVHSTTCDGWQSIKIGSCGAADIGSGNKDTVHKRFCYHDSKAFDFI